MPADAVLVGPARTHAPAWPDIVKTGFPDDKGGTRFVGRADLLPKDIADGVSMMMGQGISIIKKTMEAAAKT